MGHLSRVLGFAGLLFVVLGLITSEAEGQKKKKGAKKADVDIIATPAEYKQIENRKELNTTIVNVTGNTVTFRVDYSHLQQNPKYRPPKNTNPKIKGGGNQQAQMMRAYQNLMRTQQQAMTAKTPQQRAQAMQRFYQQQARFQQQYQQQYNRLMQQYAQAAQKGGKKTAGKGGANDPFILVTTTKEYELELEEKYDVRKMYLPFEYDDAGNVRKYTEEEKKALRGDDKKKPGYSAKIEEATPGTEAKLYLTPPPKKKKAAKDTKDDEEFAGEATRPTIRRLVLTKEGPAESLGGAPEKKKRKKK